MRSKKHVDSLAIQSETSTQQCIIASLFRANMSKAVEIDLSAVAADQTETDRLVDATGRRSLSQHILLLIVQAHWKLRKLDCYGTLFVLCKQWDW